MEHATMMDLTLHDSSSHFEEDLALITGNSQTSSTARKNNITVNKSVSGSGSGGDDDTLSDVHSFSLGKVTGSDSEVESSEEEFGKIAISDKSDDMGSDMEVEQNSQAYSESKIDRKGNKQILNGNKREVSNDNDVLNNDESGDIIDVIVSKKRSLKRERKKREACSVSNIKEEAQSKISLVHKREPEECYLAVQKNCDGLEGHFDSDNESQNADLMKTLRIKAEKQKCCLRNIKCKSGEAVMRDDGVDSVSEEDGDITEENVQKQVAEYWEDIYGRTRDKQGRVIQVRIYW
jgi:hypothetical protein